MNLFEEILNNSGLLLEATVDEIYNKFYKDIDRDKFNSLLKADPTYKGGKKKGKYLKWILDNAPLENIKDTRVILGKYERALNIVTKKEIEDLGTGRFRFETNINKLSSIAQVDGMNKRIGDLVSDKLSTFESKETSNENTKLLLSNNKYNVYVPVSRKSAIRLTSKLCKNAKLPPNSSGWCTSSPSNNSFDDYSEKYNLIIFESKTKTGVEHAYQYSSLKSEFRNLANEGVKISYNEFLKANFNKEEIELIAKGNTEVYEKSTNNSPYEHLDVELSLEQEVKKAFDLGISYKLLPKKGATPKITPNTKERNTFRIEGYIFKDTKMELKDNKNEFINCLFQDSQIPNKKALLKGKFTNCVFQEGMISNSTVNNCELNDVSIYNSKIANSKWYKGFFIGGKTKNNQIYDWENKKYVTTDESPSEFKNSHQNCMSRGALKESILNLI